MAVLLEQDRAAVAPRRKKYQLTQFSLLINRKWNHI